MRIDINRRLAAAAVVPVLALSLTACGGDNDKDKDADKPSTTNSASQDPSSEAPSDTETEASTGDDVSTEDFAQLVTDGLEASTTAKMKMDITATGMVTTATGEVDYTGGETNMHMKMTMPGTEGEMDIIMLDGIMYMNMPMLGSEGYFKIDMTKESPLTEQFGSLEQFDLRTTMKMFTEGLKSVETIGDEDIDGVATTHYVIATDTSAMTEMLGEAGGTSTAVPEIPETIEYDVWLDDEGRFIKMTADLDASGTIEMTMSDWGTPVEIKAPPADQVQDMPGSALGG